MSNVQVFGIRHHGPGSARSLVRALKDFQPDIVLVEGPPEADGELPLVSHADMKPPVALLVYAVDDPKQAVFYPFAVFSPEWQAIRFALSHETPVRFMDLPMAHRLAEETAPDAPAVEESSGTEPVPALDGEPPAGPPEIGDPLQCLAEAAGFQDGERWWEFMVEHRDDSSDIFRAVMEAMTALRHPDTGIRLRGRDERLEARREAFMRQTIRAAQREGFQNVAVVCGAWHAPALIDLPPAKRDADLLKGLPKTKVAATWVPWTYDRLSYASGYGAGIESPGWYHHLWTARHEFAERGSTPGQVTIRWMTRIAGLMRGEDLDASTAHVIEAVRLAESLAGLRGRPLPGLPELNEAARAVICFGNDLPMKLIHERLIVGHVIGRVPDETPMVPLQQDLLREQKRLRLAPEAGEKTLDLDLRKPLDLERSCLLHRLNLLGIGWGKPQRIHGKSGTFHEYWLTRWEPEFSVKLIEMSVWGNTVRQAATAFVGDRATPKSGSPVSLALLTGLLGDVLAADLPEAVEALMTALRDEAALSSDVTHLMDALPPLAQVARYGNVRQTDADAVASVIDGFTIRICVGLPSACASLDDAAAEAMFKRIADMHGCMTLLQNEDHTRMWFAALLQIADRRGVHGLPAGKCCRILLDSHEIETDGAARRLGLALSTAEEPARAAAWVEGFLKGSGLLLLHDDALWRTLDEWVSTLSTETFTALLPLLRRTFSTFPAPERRQMGERVRRGLGAGDGKTVAGVDPERLDSERAARVLPTVARLLGVAFNPT